MEAINTPERLMTIKEIARYLHLHEMTVYRLAKQGKLPIVRVGGRWRAKREMIENHVR